MGHPNRHTFHAVIVACCALGIFGLARVTAPPLTLAGVLAVVVWIAAALRRRHIESARERFVRTGTKRTRP